MYNQPFIIDYHTFENMFVIQSEIPVVITVGTDGTARVKREYKKEDTKVKCSQVQQKQ